MSCLDCEKYPLCINYPDGTWRTVYDESQEAIARQYKSAKDIDIEAINSKANDLVVKALAEKEKKREAEQDAPIIQVQMKMKTEKPMDIPKPRFGASIQYKKPCKGC
jgi:hypothetical protein